MRIDFYSQTNTLLKENVPAECVIIKSEDGVPICIARKIGPKQYMVHHAGEPNFEPVLAAMGIPFKVEVIRENFQADGKSPFLLPEERKLIIPS